MSTKCCPEGVNKDVHLLNVLYFSGGRRKLDISKYPRDKVILFQIPRCLYAPNFSPFPLKLETYLRMANIPYQVRRGHDAITWIINHMPSKVWGEIIYPFPTSTVVPMT